ncbi:MAG: rhodanese-like domain-containing protein [Sarcina sp.]
MNFLKSLLGMNDNTIDGKTAIDMINNNSDILILDVRTKDEFKGGSIPKAINIPVGELANKLSTIKKYKDKSILVYCASGMRSKNALLVLEGNGFEKVYNLKGGINSYVRNI